MALDFKRYRFTVKEYEEMGRAGIFDEDARVELLDGEIVEMTPIGDRHFLATVRATAAFSAAFREVALVSVQGPVRLGKRSEPQPDLALVGLEIGGVPSAADVLLLVEVADTTVEPDRRIKVPLYARAGVREVWLVDLRHDVVEIHRDPTPKGSPENILPGHLRIATVFIYRGVAWRHGGLPVRPGRPPGRTVGSRCPARSPCSRERYVARSRGRRLLRQMGREE